jgi:probable F420-dependent oxidoreductase
MMGPVQPFSFAIHRSAAATADEWLAFVRRAEALGYEAVYIPDHLGRQLSPFGALAAAAAVTSRIRLAAYVFANDYRHPLLLAREVATLDLLSNGRVDLGLGAGWMTSDYRQLGLPYDEPKVRIDRLEESVGIVVRLLAGETVTHDGPHYRLERATVAPAPVQRPIPLMIGGGGPRMLRFAARHADIVGLIPQMDRRGRPHIPQATDRATEAKARLVRSAAGDRADRIRLDVIVFDAGLVGSGSGLLPSLGAAAKGAAVNLLGTPYVLYGSLGEVVDRLQRRRDRTGISHYTLPGHAIEAMAPLVDALTGR